MDVHEYARADFDPKSRSVKISDLQSIFIDHGIRYNKAKTKADYIALYEEHIRPQAPRLLARAEKVRASSVGIEDRRLPSSTESDKPRAKKPLVPPQRAAGLPSSKSSSRLSAEPAEPVSGLKNSRKATSMHNLAAAASSSKATKGPGSRASLGRQPSVEPPRRLTRRSASVEIIQDTDDEQGMDIDEEEAHTSRHASRGTSGRKVSQLASMRAAAHMVINEDDDEEEDELMDSDEEEEPVKVTQNTTASATNKSISTSPMRRPVVEIPVPHRRKSDMESPHKRKVPDSEVKSEAASGFVDFNPFQSSPDEEAKSKRRRKSSMGGVKREASAEPSAIKRSKTLSDLVPKEANEGIPVPRSRQDSSSSKPPMTSEGLERFKKRISSTPDTLPSPLRRHLSPQAASERNSRPSFTSLATAPEDFEMSAYSSPRKADERRSRSPEKAREVARQPIATPSTEQIVPDYTEEEPIYQSQADHTSDSDDGPVVASSSSALQTRGGTPSHVQKKVSPKKGPAPPTNTSQDLVRASEKSVARSSKDIARKSLQVSGLATSLLLLTMIWQSAIIWSDCKRALGFCDTGEDLNEAVVRRQDQSALVRHRDLDLQSWQDYVDRARDFVAPLTCTPCPEQGVCSNGKLSMCSQGYIEQPNALAAVVFGQQYALDTSKSVIPLVLSPRCVPDTAYLHRVLEIAAASSAHLRHVKGDLLCSGHKSRRIREAKKLEIIGSKDAYIYGTPEEQLKGSVQHHLEVDATETDFERKFSEALGYLSNHTEIVTALHDNTKWIAATSADMPLGCRARLAAYSVADEHKGLLSLVTAILALLGYGQRSIKHRREIAEEVEELVPLSLSLLQAQDQNYNLRDSMTPVPYLAPAQLRDLVLRDERSASRKAELWKQVEKAVESNANVRARMAEQHGEEIRVWQWVGGAYETDLPAIEPQPASAAPAPSTNRRRSYANLAARSSLSRPGTPRVSLGGGNRHITWDEDAVATAQETKPYF